MGSDWDDSGSEADAGPAQSTSKSQAIPAAKKKWNDEDAEDEVKDDWDAASDDDSKPAQSGPLPPVRKKGITKQKIAEKEAAEQARAEREAELLAEANDPEARRRAAREREMKADLDNARGLFGDAAVDAVAPSGDPFAMNPKTKEDFMALSQQISELIISKYSTKPLYKTFVEEHIKALCQPLGDVDVRKASSSLAALANEKQKAAKEGAGGKKKTKGAVKPVLGGGKTVSRAADTSAYDEALDDDLDFM